MYKKIVSIVVLGLLIATAMSAVGTFNEKEIPVNNGIGINYSANFITPQNTKSSNYGNMFIQLPWLPDPLWSAPFSDDEFGYIAYDDFFDLSAPICDVHWWGFSVIDLGGGWESCDPSDMKFTITIYEDNDSYPGDVVCSYVDVTPNTPVPTGVEYMISTGAIFELYYFEYDLDPCCQISDGWISVYNSYCPNDCVFAWIISPYGNGIGLQYDVGLNLWYDIEDLALVLTDGEEEAIPDLECEGRLYWEDVKPGENVTGSFNIRNNGDPGSILHCKGDLSSIPTWGNWTFSSTAGILLVDHGWQMINITVTAPDEKNKEFTGKLLVVNTMDSSDYCEIEVYLKTPRTRTTSSTLLSLLYERFPNAFPILKQILGLI